MRRYSAPRALLLAFFSRSLYQDVAWRWEGTGLRYLLLVLAVCWLPLVVKWQVRVWRFATREAPPWVEQVPPISIHGGGATVHAPQPCFINHPDTGKPFAILDTTGKHWLLEGTEATVLLTQFALKVRFGGGDTESFLLLGSPSFELDQGRINAWLRALNCGFFVVGYPVLLFGSYLYRIVQALLYGLIGLAFAELQGVPLRYKASLRLAIVATTPAVALNTLAAMTGVSIPAWWPTWWPVDLTSVAGCLIPTWWLVCFGLAMIYLFAGVVFATNATTVVRK